MTYIIPIHGGVLDWSNNAMHWCIVKIVNEINTPKNSYGGTKIVTAAHSQFSLFLYYITPHNAPNCKCPIQGHLRHVRDGIQTRKWSWAFVQGREVTKISSCIILLLQQLPPFIKGPLSPQHQYHCTKIFKETVVKKVPRAGWQTLTWCSVAWHMCKTLFINLAESAGPKPGALLLAGCVPTVRWGRVKLFGASDVSPHENGRNLDSIAVSLSTNRRQDPNIYSDTETRALSSVTRKRIEQFGWDQRLNRANEGYGCHFDKNQGRM